MKNNNEDTKTFCKTELSIIIIVEFINYRCQQNVKNILMNKNIVIQKHGAF